MPDNTRELAHALTGRSHRQAARYQRESNVKLDLSRLIAALCAQAERIAQRVVEGVLKERPRTGQVGLSKAVRNALRDAGTEKEINECARQLLPEHAG